MKKLVTALMFLVTTPVAFAANYSVEATVVEVQPNYVTQQVPREVCGMVEVPVQVQYPGQVIERHKDGTKLLINTAIGGAIGHQIGRGGGRTAATIIGALLGAGVTNDEVRSTYGHVETEYRRVEQCHTEYTTQRVQDGYFVTYNYNNLIGSKYTSVYPGSTINITVSIGE